MKKIFTLFAAVALGFAAYAQEACPSVLSFAPMAEEQDANKVMIELQLVNSSLNLNGFNMEVGRYAVAEDGTLTADETMQWAEDEDDENWVGFTGYGHTILARWEGVTDNKREQQLFMKCDLNCNVKDDTGNLVIIEILKTNDCRFFPILTEEDDNTIARFTLDFSACEDTKEPLILKSDATPQGCSFSYTGGVEGTVAWTIDAPIVLELDKIDGIIKKAVDTGISTINTDQPADNRIFDLQGRELNRVPESGIYIQNGKKYVK